jgi:acetyl-CoA acetyltransferase
MSAPTQRAVILGGNRIPFARSNKQYAKATNLDMLTSAIDGLVARFGLAGENIGEVAGGAVLKHSKDFNLTREAVLGSALAPTTPAFDLGQACATGLEAVVSLNNKINAGQIESGIASAWTRPPMRRSSSTTRCARSCSSSPGPRPWWPEGEDRRADPPRLSRAPGSEYG